MICLPRRPAGAQRKLRGALPNAPQMCYNNCRKAAGIPAADTRPWRSWISQQIPILKAGGSNPSGRAKEEKAVHRAAFSFLFGRDSNPERVRAEKNVPVARFARGARAAGPPFGGSPRVPGMAQPFRHPSGRAKEEKAVHRAAFSFLFGRDSNPERVRAEKNVPVARFARGARAAGPPFGGSPRVPGMAQPFRHPSGRAKRNPEKWLLFAIFQGFPFFW